MTHILPLLDKMEKQGPDLPSCLKQPNKKDKIYGRTILKVRQQIWTVVISKKQWTNEVSWKMAPLTVWRVSRSQSREGTRFWKSPWAEETAERLMRLSWLDLLGQNTKEPCPERELWDLQSAPLSIQLRTQQCVCMRKIPRARLRTTCHDLRK